MKIRRNGISELRKWCRRIGMVSYKIRLYADTNDKNIYIDLGEMR